MASSKLETITPEMVKSRINLILRSLAKSVDFEFNMLLLQTANWPKAKRRQVFRAILKTLMTENQSYTWRMLSPVLRQNNVASYGCHSHIITAKLFDKFVSKVMEMEKNSRFMPEKVFTLPKLNTKILMVEPTMLKYLFDNNILVLGESFEWTSINILPTTENQTVYRYIKTNLQNVAKIYDTYSLNKEIVFSPQKLQLTVAARMIQNINIISGIIINKERMTANNRRILTDSLILLKNLNLNINMDLQKIMRGSNYEMNQVLAALKSVRKEEDMSDPEYFKVKTQIEFSLFDVQKAIKEKLGEDTQEKLVEFEGEAFDPFTAKI